MQGKEAGGTQNDFAKPTLPEQQQEDADYQLQGMDGHAVEQGAERRD